MSAKQLVWIVETGCYDERRIAGVYASAAAALRAHPVKREGRDDLGRGSAERSGGWREDQFGGWDNGLDWDEAAYVTAYEVRGT